MKALPLALAVLATVTYSGQAALTITGGDFGAGDAPGDILDVPDFFESSTAAYNYNDYTTGHPDHFSVNHSRKLALDWGVAGYVYQDMGAWSGESSVTLLCDSMIRDAATPPRDASSVGSCTWSVWAMDPATVGVDGSTPGDLGGTELDSWYLNASLLTYTADTSTFEHTYDISGASAGDHIWLMIMKDPTDTHEVVFDNLSVVPEPTVMALLGLAGAAGLILRRRRA